MFNLQRNIFLNKRKEVALLFYINIYNKDENQKIHKYKAFNKIY